MRVMCTLKHSFDMSPDSDGPGPGPASSSGGDDNDDDDDNKDEEHDGHANDVSTVLSQCLVRCRDMRRRRYELHSSLRVSFLLLLSRKNTATLSAFF
jgi:hypothetical protein